MYNSIDDSTKLRHAQLSLKCVVARVLITIIMILIGMHMLYKYILRFINTLIHYYLFYINYKK